MDVYLLNEVSKIITCPYCLSTGKIADAGKALEKVIVQECRERKESLTLTKKDWIEIYHSLNTKLMLIEEETDRWGDEDGIWRAYLKGIMDKIGVDGRKKWDEPEPYLPFDSGR